MSIALALLQRFWPYIAMAVLALAVYVQTERLNATKEQYASFVATIKAQGEVAEREAKRKDQENKQAKEKADAENVKTKRDLAGVYDAYGRLRDSHSYRGLLPGPTASTASSPICYDRAGLAEAMGVLERGIPVITRKGDEAIADLNSAKAWAK